MYRSFRLPHGQTQRAESKGELMKEASAESARFEPTVFGAISRYRIMVIVFALAGLVGAVAYTKYVGRTYQAQASVTVPVPQSLQNQDSAQYLDSQVLLLGSPAVARRAASFADATLQSNSLSAADFSASGGSVSIAPPIGASAGSYGSSIVSVAFTAPNARVAQVGANSLLQAFSDVRSATIAAQFKNAAAGIDSAINETTDPVQRAALKAQRTQQLVNEQIDLAQLPTISWASEPPRPVSGSSKKTAVIGLVIGFVIGAALAYVRASRRRGFSDRQDPAALYGVPLLGEIPAFEAEKALRSNGAAASGLPVSVSPHSAVAEAFRFTAGSLERIRAERGPQLSLVFVSPLADAGKSMVVANLALAIANGGTRVLAVDADTGDGDLTARLLPGTSVGGGLEQVLAGQQQLLGCIQPSPLNDAVSVLASGPPLQRRVTGAARSKAASALLATAKSSFDIVLVDSPGLLQVADATELVDASDAAIIVLSPNEQIRDHLEMVDRLKLIGTDVAGYIYSQAPMPPQLVRHLRNGSSGRPTDIRKAVLLALSGGRQPNGGSHPSSEADA
jgi:Mrp family chromosome partitioning ATPase/capsular polysaccharide biosynthesis protein